MLELHQIKNRCRKLKLFHITLVILFIVILRIFIDFWLKTVIIINNIIYKKSQVALTEFGRQGAVPEEPKSRPQEAQSRPAITPKPSTKQSEAGGHTFFPLLMWFFRVVHVLKQKILKSTFKLNKSHSSYIKFILIMVFLTVSVLFSLKKLSLIVKIKQWLI
jgi:hypothetical protein